MRCKRSSTGATLHGSAQQEVLSREALLRQIAAACGPQQHLFLAATSKRWRSMYCAYSATQETSYQSCLATPQLMRYALQTGLADMHRHRGNRAKIVQPPVEDQDNCQPYWLYKAAVGCRGNNNLHSSITTIEGNKACTALLLLLVSLQTCRKSCSWSIRRVCVKCVPHTMVISTPGHTQWQWQRTPTQ